MELPLLVVYKMLTTCFLKCIIIILLNIRDVLQKVTPYVNDPLLVDLEGIPRRPVLTRKEHAQAFALVQDDHFLVNQNESILFCAEMR